MQLLRNVKIEGFRSIASLELDELGHATALIGRNSSGKSNVLRALNLFFNDEVDPGVAIDFARDVFSRPKSKKKKLLRITVGFELPSDFKFHKQLKSLETEIEPEFTIVSTWTLGQLQVPERQDELFVGGAPLDGGARYVGQFLRLIRFRYVPNRAVPTDILRSESQLIGQAIFKRIRQAETTKVLAGAQQAGANFLSESSTAMTAAGAPLSDVSMSTAQTLAEMVEIAGFTATGAHGGEVRDTEWGSGHQAFFLYDLLHTVDTDRSASFGWRQATVWAIEEPESGLHFDLEHRLAERFRDWTGGRKRFQTLLSTHSPVFAMSADAGYLLRLDGGATGATKHPASRLVIQAELAGVTAPIQPILAFPTDPVVLVEGETDAKVLEHVSEVAGRIRLRFVHLPGLDGRERRGGKDPITAYLKQHSSLLTRRPTTAPFLVLFDWDVSEQDLAKARKAYGTGGDELVVRMNPGHAHRRLGEDFRGIERFYPVSAVKKAQQAGVMTMGIPMEQGQPYSITKSQLAKAKMDLMARVLRTKRSLFLQTLVKVLRDVERVVANR